LAHKAAALAAVEEQLRQEQATRQQAEAQLQQERAALVEPRAVLEREHLAREEALSRLQQERTALEGAQATLKQQEDEALKLNGELVQLSVSLADACQSLEEQEATVLSLQQAAEDTCQALEAEKKQVEGELSSVRLIARRFALWGSAPNFFPSLFMAFRTAGRLGEFNNPGPSRVDSLQLLTTGVGGVAGRRPRDLPGV
jgi:hypothetical protein